MLRGKSIISDFTKGNIPKQLFVFMIPFMASNVLQVLYSAVDMIIVGRFVGTNGLSAVSVSSQVLNFCTMICTGLCTGGQVLIAQMLGAQKKGRFEQGYRHIISVCDVVGGSYGCSAVLCAQPVLHSPQYTAGGV